MYYKILIVTTLLFGEILYSQKIEKIVFEHSNAIIIGTNINITLEPIANNKKGKVRINVKKVGEEYNTRISREKFRNIFNAIQKINPTDLYTVNKWNDTIAVLGFPIDPSSSSITVYDNDNDNKLNHRSYYADNLTKKSEYNEKQKGFWYATKLIIDAAKLRMEDLVNYR